jgi:hypothetical protein
MDPEPSCTGRDFVDSAERGSLEEPAGGFPTSFDLLATAGLGGAGRLVEHPAGVSERVERAPVVEVKRIVSGREFCRREKMGCGVGKTKPANGTKWMVVVDGCGLVLGNSLHSASPPEVKLANRVRPATQDGRALRRYQRRWIVERTNAWLGNFRRLVVRYARL